MNNNLIEILESIGKLGQLLVQELKKGDEKFFYKVKDKWKKFERR